MWSPNGKVWSPEIENVESKISQSRICSVMMTFGPLEDPIFTLCDGLPLSFSQIFSLATLARLHHLHEVCYRRN